MFTCHLLQAEAGRKNILCSKINKNDLNLKAYVWNKRKGSLFCPSWLKFCKLPLHDCDINDRLLHWFYIHIFRRPWLQVNLTFTSCNTSAWGFSYQFKNISEFCYSHKTSNLGSWFIYSSAACMHACIPMYVFAIPFWGKQHYTSWKGEQELVKHN